MSAEQTESPTSSTPPEGEQPRRGRKRKDEQKVPDTFTFRMPADVRAGLEQRATTENKGLSALVVAVLRAYLDLDAPPLAPDALALANDLAALRRQLTEHQARNEKRLTDLEAQLQAAHTGRKEQESQESGGQPAVQEPPTIAGAPWYRLVDAPRKVQVPRVLADRRYRSLPKVFEALVEFYGSKDGTIPAPGGRAVDAQAFVELPDDQLYVMGLESKDFQVFGDQRERRARAFRDAFSGS